MIKLVGILLLVLSGTVAGVLAALSLRGQVYRAERLCQFLREWSVKMRFSCFSVPELLEQFRDVPGYAMFSFPGKILENLSPEGNLSTVWTEAIEEEQGLTAFQRELLLPLGRELGTSDIQGQLDTLQQYQQQLEPYTEQLRQNCQKKQKLYASMGLLTGLLAAVILC